MYYSSGRLEVHELLVRAEIHCTPSHPNTHYAWTTLLLPSLPPDNTTVPKLFCHDYCLWTVCSPYCPQECH